MARHLLCWLVVFAVFGTLATSALAAVPSEKLLPNTTVGFVAVPDVDALRAKWKTTELGQMFDDPIMKPFAEDLNVQLKSKLSKTGIKLGITWEDLDGVYGGEVCFAAVQPGHETTKHGLVLIVDVTGKDAAVAALLKKVTASQVSKGSKVTTKKVAGETVTTFELKKKEGAIADHAHYIVLNNTLVATDNEPTLAAIIGQIKKQDNTSLASVKAYDAAMSQVVKASGETKPHLRWYINPFSYAEVTRAMAGGKKKRGKDILAVLREQGFGAVQGAAGFVTLGENEHEILHRSFIYAPKDPKATEGEKYVKAANMLQFPNKKTEGPPTWLPSGTGTYVSINWKMKEAFGKYLGSLVDAYADQKIFEDVLSSLKEDPQGPMVDIRAGLIDQLGERMIMLSDSVEPITTKSERLMFAFQLTGPDVVAKTLDKAMEKDPEARKREHKGHIIWEISNEVETELTVDEIKIDGPGFIPVEAVAVVEEEEGTDPTKLPNSAVTVAHGHLIVASHVDFIVKALDTQEVTLDKSPDFDRVQTAMTKLGAGNEAVMQFVRTDKAYQTTYELIRQNKMPQAETVLGKLLNRLAASDDEDDEVVRKQAIDGEKMPEFSAIRKYFGPAGFYVSSEDEGWLVTGCLLKK